VDGRRRAMVDELISLTGKDSRFFILIPKDKKAPGAEKNFKGKRRIFQWEVEL